MSPFQLIRAIIPIPATHLQRQRPQSLSAHSFQCVSEPSWRPREQFRRSELPGALADWLFDPNSLTKRLRATCRGDFRVSVLRQYRARPLPSEAHVLKLQRRGFVWVREVQLLCDSQPWVFARTLIPQRSMQGRCRYLTRLGTRPLGEVLFSDPLLRRGQVQVARIAASQRLHRRAFAGLPEPPEAIWGRRSLFFIGSRPVLVCEIFLPNLPLERSTSHCSS